MKARNRLDNRVVAAFSRLLAGLALFVALLTPVQATADAAALDRLFADLQTADGRASARIEREIWNEWSKSGSAAMDLLLQRGRDAMQAGDAQAAIGHFTALVDHAPGFAEGWNARATAYFQAGKYGPSISDIAQVLTLEPRHFGALSGLGMIYEQVGKPEQALKVYRAALAIHPQMSSVLEAVKRLEKDVAGQDL